MPASPLEQTSPTGFFPDGQVSAPSSYESSLGPPSDSPVVPPAGYGHSQVSPLTPPEQYDSRGYLRDGIPTPRPILARPPMTDYAPQGTMSFNFGDSLPQLWNMDGAPASPPPLPDFDFFSSQSLPQRYVHPPPAPPSHKPPPGPTPVYVPSQAGQPVTSHRHSVPSITTSAHHNATYQSLRTAPPQPHPIRTTFPRGYHEGYPQHPPHTYAPGSSPTRSFTTEFMAPYRDGEGENLSDYERLRIRLLEEAYHNRSPPGPSPNSGGSAGGRYGSTHHSPDQWVNGGQRYGFT